MSEETDVPEWKAELLLLRATTAKALTEQAAINFQLLKALGQISSEQAIDAKFIVDLAERMAKAGEAIAEVLRPGGEQS